MFNALKRFSYVIATGLLVLFFVVFAPMAHSAPAKKKVEVTKSLYPICMPSQEFLTIANQTQYLPLIVGGTPAIGMSVWIRIVSNEYMLATTNMQTQETCVIGEFSNAKGNPETLEKLLKSSVGPKA